VPAKKTTRRAPAPRVEEPAGDGLVIRIAERALDNPAMSGGLLVMGLTAMAIVSNALFLQNARHPDPFFMTRPTPAAVSPVESAVPIPRPRVEPPPAPAHVAPAQPAPAPVATQAASETIATDKPTIAAIQRALLSRGYYRGTVDGRTGAQTRAAITAYQKAEGLKPTGQTSTELLDHLRTGAVKPVAITPRQPAPVKLPPEPVGRPAASAEPAVRPAPIAAAAPADPIAAVVAPEEAPAVPPPQPLAAAPAAPAEAAPPVAAAPGPSEAAVAAARRTINVQNALNQIGYGPVQSDGMLNDETVNAIRRFELDNGMAITGRIGDQLINKLVSIGAMNPA
jgi:peptidoglycan hydrolase-like protein with peptidoglycan-binding domain